MYRIQKSTHYKAKWEARCPASAACCSSAAVFCAHALHLDEDRFFTVLMPNVYLCLHGQPAPHSIKKAWRPCSNPHRLMMPVEQPAGSASALATMLVTLLVGRVVGQCTTQTVVVSGTAGAQTKRMGVFTMQPALTAGGKPVYMNSKAAFSYYWPAFKDWRMSNDITSSSAGVRSTSSTNTLCPEDSSGWEEYADGNWLSGISVVAGA